MAGIVYAALHGFAPGQALRFALGAGLLAISSEDTINPAMNINAVNNMIKEYLL